MGRIASLLFFLFFCVQTADACSCSISNAVCSAYWDTPLVFRGRVTGIKFVPDEPPQERVVNGKLTKTIGPGTLEVQFHVIENFRGNAGSETVIHTPSQGPACGVQFRDGAEYLVYAHQQAREEWWTGSCTRTHEIINAEEDADLAWIHGLKTAQPGGTVFGTVTQLLPDFATNGYKNQPLAGIPLRVQGPETRIVKTDNEGNFSAAGLPVGKYEVRPEYPDGLGPPAPTVVSVRDKGCAEVSFSAQPDGVVDGNILNADLTPAAGLYVRLKRAEENHAGNWTLGNLYVATTDSAGHFRFEPVESGSYILGVNLDFPAHGGSFRHKNFYPGTVREDQAEIIHIVGAQHVQGLRYVLPPEPERKDFPVKVRIVLPNGLPAANASIELWNPQWPNLYWGSESKKDAAGWYTIELPEGELYNLFARAEGSGGQYPCGGPVAIVASANVKPVILVLNGSQGSCYAQRITEAPQK